MVTTWIRNFLAVVALCAAAAAQFATHGALLAGSHEVPPNGSLAVGSASFTLNLDNSLSYVVATANGLSGTAAHIHSGLPGVNGPVLFPLAGGPTTWSGTTPPLNAGQLASLASGALYVNVHSAALPSGEIRDQLRPVTMFDGVQHLAFGSASLSPGAGGLLVAGIGGTMQDGVEFMASILGTMEDGPFSGFVSATEYDPAVVPVGAVLQTSVIGFLPLSGLRGQLLANFGMQAVPSGFTALVDYAPSGSPTYTANVYDGDQLLLSLPALTSGQVSVGGLAAKLKLECETELETECCPAKVVLTLRWKFGSSVAMTVGGVPVTGDALEFVPDVDPGAAQVERFRVAATGMPAFTMTGERVRELGNLHAGLGEGSLLTGIGSIGQDGVECVAGIGSSGKKGVECFTSPAESYDIDVEFQLAAPPNGAEVGFSTVGTVDGIAGQSLGSVTLTRASGAWQVTADFSAIGSPTQHLQVLSGGALLLDLPGHAGPVCTASTLPTALGKLGGEIECIVEQHPPGTVFVVDGTPYVGDELRILAETSSLIGPKESFIIWMEDAWEFHFQAAVQISAEVVVPWSPAWTSLGGALAGTLGAPVLAGSGTLAPATVGTLTLSNAAPFSLAALFFSAFSVPVPFKGGVLQAFPLLSGPVFVLTPPAGSLALPFAVPAGIPSGLQLWFQYAIQDAGAVQGTALSNALRANFP